MSDWLDTLAAVSEDCALVTVIGTVGSTPRETGTRMLVTEDRCLGTIGGGQLEYRVVALAREMLAGTAEQGSKQLHSFTLGPELKQCCGGVVRVVIEVLPDDRRAWVPALADLRKHGPCVVVSEVPGERPPAAGRLLISARSMWGSLGEEAIDLQLATRARQLLSLPGDSGIHAPDAIHEFTMPGDASALLFEVIGNVDFQVMLFGAGHVGKALVQVLGDLPCHITWVDSRAAEFPANIPPNVTVRISDAPAEEVSNASPDTYFLVMTHSHPADFEICRAVLGGEFAYLGLIGSASKRNRFRKNLVRNGIPAQLTERLTCPIGIASIRSKHPAAIAIAVAAELIETYEQANRSESRPALQAAARSDA